MTTNYRISLWCFSAILLAIPGQASADFELMTSVLRQTPALSSFDICHGGGCTYVSQVQLSEDEWKQIGNVCSTTPESAEAERACISKVIGEYEKVIGAKTGTDTDRGGTFGNSAYQGQMDCNDEAINTTTYLKLMQQHGLIQYHDVLDVKRRGFFLNRWPHTTAAIQERASQQLYAVDAWFYDNGMPAVIVPFERWKAGWKPVDSLAR